MEELRDTHRLESSSQTDLVSKLRTQLSTAESNLATRAPDLAAIPQLRTDLSKAQTQVKEEEEKRTKAISLLKTVRLKLVKAEKDKEEVERDRAEERAERSRAMEEVEKVKADRDREVNRLRQGFERELQSAKERAEREMKERTGAWELEMITTKVSSLGSWS
jgi:protein subunit release factor B